MSKEIHELTVWLLVIAACICMLLGEQEGARWLAQMAVLLEILDNVKKG